MGRIFFTILTHFGPKSDQNRSVVDLLEEMAKHWGFKSPNDAYVITDNIPFHEAGLLKLNCDKALSHLQWEPTLTYETCVKKVSDWYYNFYFGNEKNYDLTLKQISNYEELAKLNGAVWS